MGSTPAGGAKLKLNIPWPKPKAGYDCEKDKHNWTMWKVGETIRVFEKETDKYPKYHLKVQERTCKLCGLLDVKRTKVG